MKVSYPKAQNPSRSGGSRRGSGESGEGVEKPEKQARLVLRFNNCLAGFERFLCYLCDSVRDKGCFRGEVLIFFATHARRRRQMDWAGRMDLLLRLRRPDGARALGALGEDLLNGIEDFSSQVNAQGGVFL